LANKGKATQVRTKTPSDINTLEWIAVDKLREDFTLFKSSLEEAHPSLYRYTQKKELDSLFESHYQSLTHPLSEIAFYRLLTPIIANIRCGHTGSLPSIKYGESYFSKNLYLPIQTEYIGGKLYQVRTYDTTAKPAKGHELISINGLPIEEIIRRIVLHIASDGYIMSAKYKELAWNFAKLYSLYIGHAQSFEIVSRNRQGTIETVSLPAISYDTYTSWRRERKQENEYTLLDTKTTLLKIATFTSTDAYPFAVWIEDAFRDIKQKKVANLIIDLRGNEGGRDDYAMCLLSFLAKAPFKYHQSLQAATQRFSFISYSDQPESFNAQMAQVVKQDSMGHFMIQETHPTLRLTSPKADAFAGKIYFIIDGNTFSAAADFAALAKEQDLGKFIGEETGGAAEGNTSNGEILLTLPNSGIRIGIPLFRITNAVSFSHPRGRGVIPDYPTSDTMEDFLHNRDRELELIKTLIQKSQ
jgi:hypothetical protein